MSLLLLFNQQESPSGSSYAGSHGAGRLGKSKQKQKREDLGLYEELPYIPIGKPQHERDAVLAVLSGMIL